MSSEPHTVGPSVLPSHEPSGCRQNRTVMTNVVPPDVRRARRTLSDINGTLILHFSPHSSAHISLHPPRPISGSVNSTLIKLSALRPCICNSSPLKNPRYRRYKSSAYLFSEFT